MTITRREFGALSLGAAAAGALSARARAETALIRSHGVSAFDGELKYPSDFAQFAYATPEGVTGGTYSTGFAPVTYDSLNPFILKGNAGIGITFTFDTLMTSAADEPDSVYGLLAEAIEYPEDRAWAAFEIREEARFSDGTPVTAEDVAFSFDIRREKGHPSFRLTYAAVTGATVEGPRRVRFDFDPEAARRDLPMAVASLSILSKKSWEGRDFSESSLEPILGSGPYIVDVVEPGRTLSFRRRADYWGWHLPVNTGRWHFDRLRFEYFLDRAVVLENFKAGEFSFTEEFWSKQWATGYDFAAVNQGKVLRETLPDNRPAGTQGYWFNTRRPVLQDPRVREAIAMAFDFEWSNDRLFYGLYNRTNSFFEGGPMEADGPPTPGEAALLETMASDLPSGVLDQPAYEPPVTDGSGRNRRALRRAARLLEEAGWVVDGDVRRKDGQTLTVEFMESSPAFERITIPFTENLKRMGVDAKHRTVDPARYKQRLDEFDFDIVVSRKGMSLTPGVELRGHYHSASAASPGSDNLSGVENPVVDRLIEVIERAEDRETLADAVRALDRVLRAMHIWVPQWNKASHHLAFWDIYGRPPLDRKPAYGRGVIDLWWIDPDKAARLKDEVGS
ncbi:MAG: extracellular solute-binding protein [Pseudomonadota bacterium]